MPEDGARHRISEAAVKSDTGVSGGIDKINRTGKISNRPFKTEEIIRSGATKDDSLKTRESKQKAD